MTGTGLDAKLKLFYPFYRPFEQALLKRANVVIATSPPYLASSRALARWRGKCRVIPLGLDSARIAPEEVPGACLGDQWCCDDKLRVLAVGRLSRYKGFDVLIRAATAVDDVEVVIAGEGKERRRLERLLPDGSPGRIRLVGAVDNAVRNGLMADCDVLCMPSINRAEAFGLSLVEAMAAGKPQIATRVAGSGMDWVVEEDRTGWLVPPGDVDGLAGLLRRLVGERESLRRCGRVARERFDQRFRIDAVARQIVDLYRTLA